MRILVIGSNGQLGRDFVKQAASASHHVFPVDCPEIDIRRRSTIDIFAGVVKPHVIVNCAAFTAVDACETEQETAFALNADACASIAAAAKKHSALLVHFSTDYVFDGRGTTPYTEDSPTNPQSIYGISKLRGEEAILKSYQNSMIFRIAWLYGEYGSNFVKTILRAAAASAENGKPLRVVNDQFGSPTWTVNVCRQVLSVLDKPERGIFHCTSEGSCSWYDFAKEIVTAAGIKAQVEPCTTEEYPRPAPRPKYSVLENARLKKMGANIMPNWYDALQGEALHVLRGIA